MGNPELRSRMQTEWFYVLLSRGKTSQVTCILAISHRLTRLRLSPLAQASFKALEYFLHKPIIGSVPVCCGALINPFEYIPSAHCGFVMRASMCLAVETHPSASDFFCSLFVFT
jgi:hypothetical protein